MLTFVTGCAASRPPVPVGTIPEASPVTPEEENYGHEVLQTLSQKWQLDYNHPRYQNVVDVVEKLTKAIGADKDPWHVYVLKDDSFKNAAASRGNHVFVWTGMINSTQNDEELATIIGHEIGHVLAHHNDPDPNESMRELLVQAAAIAAGIAVAQVTRNPYISDDAGRLAQELSQQVGNAIAVYPFSRDKELEADQIGLYLMAEAKYDPQQAVAFWTRAAADPAFSSSLEFFSTHPPAGDRLVRLKQLLPDAEQRYQDRLAGRTTVRPTGKPGQDSFDVSSTLGSGGANTQPAPPPAAPPYSAPSSGSGSGPSSGAGSGPASNSGSGFAAGAPLDRGDWRVTSRRAVLFTRPEVTSRKLGEFSRGTIISNAELDGDWLHVRQPDEGYLRTKDVIAER